MPVAEAVLGQRTSPSTGKLEYRLKWKGYPNEETSWEPLADCIGCEDLIAAYVEGVAAGTAAGGAAAAASAESPAPAKGRSTRVGRWVHHRDGMKVEQGLAADNTVRPRPVLASICLIVCLTPSWPCCVVFHHHHPPVLGAPADARQD